jgi:ubiquinone biosynthesis protein
MGLGTKIADLGRLKEIITIFSKAGFGDIFKSMGLEGTAELTGKLLKWDEADNIANF